MDELNDNKLVAPPDEKELENTVDKTALDLSAQIAKAGDKSELDSLYETFKLNDIKKNVFRLNKLNGLLDKITDEAVERFDKRSGEMSNKEIIDYMNAVSTHIDHSKGVVDTAKDINLTQVNNTVNVSMGDDFSSLSRSSRMKIFDFIEGILKKSTDNDSAQTINENEDLNEKKGSNDDRNEN